MFYCMFYFTCDRSLTLIGYEYLKFFVNTDRVRVLYTVHSCDGGAERCNQSSLLRSTIPAVRSARLTTRLLQVVRSRRCRRSSSDALQHPRVPSHRRRFGPVSARRRCRSVEIAKFLDPGTGPQWLRSTLFFGLLLSDFQSTKSLSFHNRSVM